ncbi:MAG TPA: DUF5985 family protein [Candidatus Baltobacteraceae bacterium]|nr:DUF5985 family protein [Candidatus Baltobacteraceae bacterium]
MTPLEAFLLGVIATASLAAALFFLKFWRSTRDVLFLAFAAFFLIQALDRTALLFFAKPNESSPWIYLVRLVALVMIVAAILKKNYGGSD